MSPANGVLVLQAYRPIGSSARGGAESAADLSLGRGAGGEVGTTLGVLAADALTALSVKTSMLTERIPPPKTFGAKTRSIELLACPLSRTCSASLRRTPS